MRCVIFLLAFACAISVVLGGKILTVDEHKAAFDDDEVWAVEFYSKMCGSCKDFEPKWDAAAKKLEALGVNVAKFAIDGKANMKHVNPLKVLNGGIPALVVYNKKGDKFGTSIDTDVGTKPANELVSEISDLLSSHTKNGSDKFLKK